MARLALRLTLSLAIAAAVCAQQWLAADSPAAAPKRRALPPKWDKHVVDSFFGNPRGTLEGDRPNFGDRSSGPAAGTVAGTPADGNPAAGGAATNPDAAAGGPKTWSKLISADALQDEIKSYQNPVHDDVKSASEFKATGFKRARDDFSMLAVTLGVIAQYDGDARWKDQAAAARDAFARAGQNCKVATDQSYNEAKSRAEDLAALIRGDTISVPAAAEAKPQWSKVSNRPQLMHRLEQAQQNRLAPWTANAADFAKHIDGITREAQVIAMLAEVIQQEGYDYTDDTSYKGFAQEMQKHALEVVEAAKTKNYDAARRANAEIGKACSNCHGGFRG